MTIEDHKNGNIDLLKFFEIVSINEWRYLYLLEYNGDGYSLISWWVVVFKNLKTKKEIKVYLHNQLTLNDERKIVRSVDYHNGNLFN